jgi:hypothetical protein
VNAQVKDILRQHGINPALFKASRGVNGVRTGRVSGKSALDLWDAIRAAHGETGVWPVFRGGEANPAGFDRVEDTAAPPRGTANALLARSYTECRRNYAKFSGKVGANVAFEEFANRVAAGGGFEYPDGPRMPWPKKPPHPRRSMHSSKSIFTDRPLGSLFLSLVAAEHPWQVIQTLGFGGFNECPRPSRLAALFREWQDQYGAYPAAVTNNVIECFVDRPPRSRKKARELAAAQWVLCEDIVMQGMGSVERLAALVWRSPNWYFWWD